MNLKIEQGILLKPYTAPLDKSTRKHRTPNGWTPERTSEMQSAFDALKEKHSDTPDYMIWAQVEQKQGERLAKQGKPWPGWFPVLPKMDKRISRAYVALFQEMNPNADKRVKVGGKWSGPEVEYPPDGDYVLRGGKMRLVEMAVALENRSVFTSLPDDWGIKSEDVKARIETLRGGTSEA
jgi:hypothetical protein